MVAEGQTEELREHRTGGRRSASDDRELSLAGALAAAPTPPCLVLCVFFVGIYWDSGCVLGVIVLEV